MLNASFVRAFSVVAKTQVAGALALGLVATVGAAPPLAQEVPYDLDKFKNILDDSKLQNPGSSPALIDYGEFEGVDFPGIFYLTNDSMTFEIEGSSNRTELRVFDEWDVSESENTMSGRVKILSSDLSSEQFSFMQAHQVDGDGPMARIYWIDSKDGHDDSIWVAYREEPNGSVTHAYLTDRSGDFVDVMITVQSNYMTVSVDGSAIEVDVSEFEGEDMYFKAGAYNQTSGTSISYYSSLSTN